MNNIKERAAYFKTNRIEALSDGVFAIVMTLLVIELSVPLVSKLKASVELGGMLLEMWPKFFAFAISFLVLGIFWFTHHSQFHFIKRSNGMFVWINILFLLSVAFIPFSTALIGEYHIYSKLAVVFWGINGFLCLLMLNIIWWYASANKRLISKKAEPQNIKSFQISLIMSAAVFLPAIGLVFINPIISIAIFVISALYGVISNIFWGSAEKLQRLLK